MSSNAGIVAHITTEEVHNWQMALRNLRNLAQDDSVSTPAEQIQVVVNGPAIRFLLESSPDAAKVATMVDAGVAVTACENSLDRFGYDTAAIMNGVSIVPSGVAAFANAQQQGAVFLNLP
jgi:intracellular sulfur oxidation DsrE/DsrF family protein